MSNPVHGLDANFLIDLWIAGGEEALETLNMTGGKCFYTTSIRRELVRFFKGDVDGQDIVDWLDANSDKVRYVAYSDTQSIRARIDFADGKISATQLGAVLKNAGERSYLELYSGRELTYNNGSYQFGDNLHVDPALKAQLNRLDFDDASELRLLTDESKLQVHIRNSNSGNNIEADFEKFNMEPSGLVNSSAHFNNLIYTTDTDSGKIKAWNAALRNGQADGVGLSNNALRGLLNDHEIDSFKTPGAASEAGAVTPRVALKASLFASSLKVLSKVGVLGDILGFSLIAAQADELYEQGKISEARKLWTSYVFELLGGVIGTAVVGLLVTGVSLNPLLGIAGGVLAGAVTGEFGKFLGATLYTEFPSWFDPAFVEIEARIATAQENGEDFGTALVSELLKYFGFTLDSESGSDTNDFILSPRYGDVSAGSGNDIIVAFDSEYIFDGEYFDTENPDSERAVGDQRLSIDAGEGDDIILVGPGLGAEVVGGLGRDLIWNYSFKGSIFGNGKDGEGEGESDAFWWSPGVFLQDPDHSDILSFTIWPLVGGTSAFGGGRIRDSLLPFVNYYFTDSGQLLVSWGPLRPDMDNDEILKKSFVVENYDFAPNGGRGDLGLKFLLFTGQEKVSLLQAVFTLLIFQVTQIGSWAKKLAWVVDVDPLVLDLDGDGIETTRLSQSDVYFDIDGDFFREKTAWVEADDGILVLDFNENGVIDDSGEWFGGAGELGLDQLAELDSNADGVIDENDIQFDELQVWQDFNQDGVSQADELSLLAAHGIVSLSLTGTPQGEDGEGRETPTENTILSEASFTRADGTTGTMAEVILQSENLDTLYRGDNGVADWAARVSPGADLIDAKGYGTLTSLAVAASNNTTLNTALVASATAMVEANIVSLRELTEPVISEWVAADPLTRELTPLLLSVDGLTVLDRGVYVEDGVGGYWTLESGSDVLAADGGVIGRGTLEDVLAQTTAGGVWELQQLWSPSERSVPVQAREAAPYLLTIEDGRAQIVDYGVWIADGEAGHWALASGQDVLDANGAIIALPTLDQVLSSAVLEGQQWRVESLGHSEFSGLPFDKMAVQLVDGIVVDYTVYVDDPDGAFHVWARNLDRALTLQEADGFGGGFALQNYVLDMDDLASADSTDESHIRVEVLTLNQYRFATALYGIEFEPNVLSARVNEEGLIEYAVSEAAANGGQLGNEPGQSDINIAINLFDAIMQVYVPVERGLAVRIASEGGLSKYFVGIDYDVTIDKFVPTGDRELAQMFEAIFDDAPTGSESETVEYLRDWNMILEVLYADYQTPFQTIDFRAYLLQNIIAGYENSGLATDVIAVAEALGIDEEQIRLHDVSDTDVEGTSGTDVFYIGAGDQTFRGGDDRDFYIVGQNFGNDIIEDVEAPFTGNRAPDTLWFSHVTSEDVSLTKDGWDLIISVDATGESITIVNQFEGENPGLFGGDLSPDTEIVSIYFADGVQWQELDIAFEAAVPLDSDDVILGTPDLDVLDGGAGNDVLRGGADSDLYIFNYGYGQDIVEDNNYRILLEAFDFLQFQGGIREENLEFERNGNSSNVVVHLVDDEGARTGDQVTVVNQFAATETGIFGAQWFDRLERFSFEDGSFLTESDIMRLVLEQAPTDGEDAIYGFHENDTLRGGKGDDYLVGGNLHDTYIFSRGDGVDVIEDNRTSIFQSSYDRLQFTDISADEIELIRDGSDLTVSLRVSSSGDEVFLRNQFQLTGLGPFGEHYFDTIEEIEFSDGSVWDFDDLARRFLSQARTEGDDTIYGFDRADTLDGGAGNDRLLGGVRSDTYIFAVGYGHDVIFDKSRSLLLSSGFDTLVLEEIRLNDVRFSRFENDLTFTLKTTGESVTIEGQYDRINETRIESFVFSDQTVPNTDLNPEDIDLVGTSASEDLLGTHYAETIDSRGGDDFLSGSSDGDTYLFDVGYGNDVIFDRIDSRRWTADDTIEFGADITTDNIQFSKEGDDLLISVDGATDTLRILGQFGASVLVGVERFKFTDGVIYKISDIEELLAITGGNRGDNVIEGLLDRENVLDGREGDDQLLGGNFGDTYAFGVGYDIDVITEVTNSASEDGAIDRVVFGELITPETLLVRRDGGDLILSVIEGTDELRIVDGLDNRQIEQFLFANGTVWGIEDVRLQLLIGTDGSDQLIGFDDRDDVLDGGHGNDILEGGHGNDVYRFNIGYGSDSIEDTGGIDRIEFGSAVAVQALGFSRDEDNLVIRFSGSDDTLVIRGLFSDSRFGVETLVFEDGFEIDLSTILIGLLNGQVTEGDDVVTGTSGADLIAGGLGDDLLRGRDGNDTYAIMFNEGFDIVEDSGSGADRLVLGQYESHKTTVQRVHPDSDDVILRFEGTDAQILIRNGLSTTNSNRVEEISFVDGAVWTASDLRARILSGAVSAGNDVVYGFSSADTIQAGAGNDIVYGGSGSDTYIYSRGDGIDVIDDAGNSGSQVDTLRLRGYSADEVIVTRPDPDSDDILLQFDGAIDEVLLLNQASSSSGRGIEQIEFGDGAIWTRSALLTLAIGSGTSRSEELLGTSSSDVMRGREGDDVLRGGDGSDIYIFRAGDGQDIIDDNGNRDTDVLKIFGYSPDDVTISRSRFDADGVVLTFAGSLDQIRIKDTLSGSSADTIERIEFEDGTVWTMDDVRTMLGASQQTGSDDVYTGFVYPDAIEGGLGDDYLTGGDGSDAYIFRAGDGQDVINDNGAGDTDVLQIFGYSPDDVIISRSRLDADGVVLTFIDSSDQIRIKDTLSGSHADTIERIEFEDGTVWTMSDLRTAIGENQQTDADDAYAGFNYGDVIEGGLGDDYLAGGDGSDTYIFRAGDGQDVINDNGAGDTDVLQIFGYSPDDVIISQSRLDADGVVLTFVDSSDQIRIKDTLSGSHADTIERIEFEDGTVWTMSDLRTAIGENQQTDSDDAYTGFNYGDVIEGGLGDDYLAGGDGSDTYIFRAGDGQDVINDNGAGDTDVLQIFGYSPGDVIISQSRLDADGVVISFVGSSDQIRIKDTLSGSHADTIERIEFEDGTVWTMSDLRTMIITDQETDVRDVIFGFASADVIEGGLGDDYLLGGDGSDTYIFRAGDGHDTINENGAGDTDVIQIFGYTSDQLVFERSRIHSDNLEITVIGSSDHITVIGNLSSSSADHIEKIVLDDGVILSRADIMARLVEYSDSTVATDGDDVIRGTTGGNTLDGGLGDDLLLGGKGNDTYLYRRGDGDDVFSEEGKSNYGSSDRLVLEDIASTDVSVMYYVGGIKLQVSESAPGAGDSAILSLPDHINTYYDRGIETIQFADGVSWSREDIRLMIIDIRQTDGDDFVRGFGTNDTLEGGLGDDVLKGWKGNDTYIYRRGDGDDIFSEEGEQLYGSSDRLVLEDILSTEVSISFENSHVQLLVAESSPGAGDDAVLSLPDSLNEFYERGIETIQFADGVSWSQADLRQMVISNSQTNGDDYVRGFNTHDTLEGGLGDDVLRGGDGNDTYIYRRGDGDDVFSEDGQQYNGSADRLVLEDILSTEVSISFSDNRVQLTVAESSLGAGDGAVLSLLDSIDEFYDRGIEAIQFADGVSWSQADLRQMVIAKSQTDGADLVKGFSTSDTLEGGLGDDVLRGGDGNDTYIYRRGDGDDVFSEDGQQYNGSSDRLVLEDILSTEVSTSFENSRVQLLIAESSPGVGDGAVLSLLDNIDEFYDRGIEAIQFSDGVSWSQADLRQIVIANSQTDGDDVIMGFNSHDTLEGGLGDDVLRGGKGNDTYIYRRGDGDDVFSETNDGYYGAADKLILEGIISADVSVSLVDGVVRLMIADDGPGGGEGATLFLPDSLTDSRDRGIEEIIFSDGEIWLRSDLRRLVFEDQATSGDDVVGGSSGDDHLSGGAGNDVLSGNAGNDVYVFSAGDGRDTVRDNGGGLDVLEIRGYAAEDIRFTRLSDRSNDLVIRFDGSADAITVAGALSGSEANTIESVLIVDSGSALTIDDISQRLLLDIATAGADTIFGTADADTLTGRSGSDLLDGRGGDDTYLYRQGDGVDRIEDTGSSAGDVLRFEDYLLTDVSSVRRSSSIGDDLIVEFGTGADVVFVTSALNEDAAGVEIVEFSDGSRLAVDQLRALVLDNVGSSLGQSIYGFAGSDVLVGGQGDDRLYGGDGADTYVFAAGDGSDTIEDNGNGDVDRVVIQGYSSLEASVDRYYLGDDGIVIKFAGSANDSLTLINTLYGNTQDGIEEIEFSDGVVWTLSDIEALLENTAPVAQRDGIFSVVQAIGTQISSAALLRNDFDADGDSLSIISVSNAENGTVQIDDSGNVIFTSVEGFTGLATFEYTVSDGNNGLATETVTVRVRPPATAVDDFGLSVDEDTFLIIPAERLLANDVDGDLLIISQVTDAVGGVVSLASTGDITFTPHANFVGEASFTYVGNTPAGGRAEARVVIEVLPVNDAPSTSNDGTFSTVEGEGLTVQANDLLSNDSDIDGDILTITQVTGNAEISILLNEEGDVVIVPAPFFFGNTSFTYTISDGQGGEDTGVATVYVEPVNDVPEPQDDSFTIDEDTNLYISVSELLANDVEHDGDGLTVTGTTNAVGGRAQLLDNGTILFTPTDNFAGEAHFFYTVNDGQGGEAAARVNVQVAPVNDNPNARDNDYEDDARLIGLEDHALIIDPSLLLGNDSDVDSLELSFSSLSNALNGSVEFSEDGYIVFTPDADYWGEASFTYVISDGDGGVDDARVTLLIEPVSDAPPVAHDDAVEIYEDVVTTIASSLILGNDTDIDNDILSIVSVDLVGRGNNASLDEDGNIVIATGENFNGPQYYDYVVTDGSDGFDTGRLYVNVLPVNDDPTAGVDTGGASFGTPLIIRISDLLENDTDVDYKDGDIASPFLEFISAQDESSGLISIYNDEFVVIELDAGFSGDVSFNYTVGDPEGATDTGLVNASVSTLHADIISGSARRDLLIGSNVSERLEGQDGSDDLFGRDGDDVLDGGDGGDNIDGGEGYDVVDYSASTFGTRVDLASRLGQGGYAQGDLLSNVEGITGSAFSDELYGNGTDNVLEGLSGHDLLDGRDGADDLQGGEGNDTLIGGAGADSLDGGADIDTADYSTSVDGVAISLSEATAAGGDAEGDTLTNIENVIGTNADDDIEGDAFANELVGGRGNDVIRGLGGDDVLIGGRGQDQLFGGEGLDTADYSQSAEGVSVDMSGATAGGGDAEGDTFSSIERLRGSFHDDTLIGDAQDNTLIGSGGADTLVGGAGTDTADYSGSLTGVTVDLNSGQGSGGDAEGDTLNGIERLTGSNYEDEFIGDGSTNIFDGGFGDDLLRGGAGSDRYIFGFDSSGDTIVEQGDASDIDRIEFKEGVRVADVSFIREGDNLLLELENDDGFLIDTLLVENHFLGTETGIEEVAFSDGTVFDRDDIFNLYRNDRFNAVDDIARFAGEDVVFNIDASLLFENDTELGGSLLTIISVQNGVDGTAELNGDGSIAFLGASNFNGIASFEYTVSDGRGRESTATVEVVVLPVNDAPMAADDGIIYVEEDVSSFIPLSVLIANDFDIDGDSLTILSVGPLIGANGEILGGSGGFNGGATASSSGVSFTGAHNYFGAAGFSYVLSDGNGGTATANVELIVTAVNDAPNTILDRLTTREGIAVTATAESLLSDDIDPEGDSMSLVSVQDAVNGAVSIEDIPVFSEFGSQEGVIRTVVFTPDAGFIGGASYTYTVADEHGATATETVRVTVNPLNDAPRAVDDSYHSLSVLELVEDSSLLIDPSMLLANDSDVNGDEIAIVELDRFPEHGSVDFDEDGMIVFTPFENYNGEASFYYTIDDGRGGRDTAEVTLLILPENDGSYILNDEITAFEGGTVIITAAEVFANDLDFDGDVLFFDAFDLFDGRGSLSRFGDDLALNIGANDYGRYVVSYTAVDTSQSLSINTGSIVVNVLPQRERPNVDNESATIAENTSYTVSYMDLLDNDSDAEGDDLAIIDVQEPDNGIVEISYTYGAIFSSNSTSSGRSVQIDLPVGMFNLLDAASTSVVATLTNGDPLPDWVEFDETGISADLPEGYGRALRILVTATDEAFSATHILHLVHTDGDDASSGSSLILEDADTLSFSHSVGDPEIGQISFDIPSSVLEIFSGSIEVDVRLSTGEVLPSWLSVDAQSAAFGLPGFESIVVSGIPPEDFDLSTMDIILIGDSAEAAENATVRLIHRDAGAAGELISVSTGETALLAGSVNEAASLQFDIPVEAYGDIDLASATITFVLADGSPLPNWLTWDGSSLVGTPPITFTDDSLDIRVLAFGGGSSVETQYILATNAAAHTYLTYTPDEDFSGSEQIVYTVSDGVDGSRQGTLNLDVYETEVAPVAYNDTAETTEDVPVIIQISDLLSNDRDEDGDDLRISAVNAGSNGRVEIDGDTILYTPNENFSGEDSFTYTVTDDLHGESTASVTVTVESTNDAPGAVADEFDGIEDTPLTISVAELLINDSDVDGDQVVFESVNLEGDGGLATRILGDQVTFTPDANFTGIATFIYTVSDGRMSSIGEILIDFAPVNDAPQATIDGIYDLSEDQTFAITDTDLLANDMDVEGDEFTLVSVQEDFNGTVSYQDGVVSFAPHENYFGNAEFTYTIGDADGQESTARVYLSVLPVNDAPVANSDDAYEMLEDTQLVINLSDLLLNDIDVDNDTITFQQIDAVSGGQVSITNEGQLLFVPDSDYNGQATISYSIADPSGATDQAVLNIQIAPVDDAPVTQSDSFAGVEDHLVIIPIADLLVNDNDPDGTALQLMSVGSAIGGIVTLDGLGNVVFTPEQNVSGQVSFTYIVADETGAQNYANVTIDLASENDAPIVTISMSDQFIAEDAFVSIEIPQNMFADVDGDDVEISATLGGGAPLPAWLAFDGRRFSGQPPVNFNGSIALAIIGFDGLVTTTEQFVLEITPENDAPVLQRSVSDVSIAEDEAIYVELPIDVFTDPDTTTLALSAELSSGAALPDWLAFDGFAFSGTPPLNFNGDFEILLTADDGEFTVSDAFTLRVTALNDGPVATIVLQNQEYDEDSAISFAIPQSAFVDPDADELEITASLADGSDLPDWLIFDGNRFEGTPPENFSGQLEISVMAMDAELSVQQSFMLVIRDVNDAPIIVNALPDLSFSEDSEVSFALPQDAFTDVDGDALILEAQLADGAALPIWLTFDGAGFHGLPPANYVGSLQVVVSASDGQADVSSSFTLTIENVNDAPIAVNDAFDGVEDEQLIIPVFELLSNDYDLESNSFQITEIVSSAGGTAHLDGQGNVVFVPEADFNGEAGFVYRVVDLFGAASDASVAITLEAVNDAPMATTTLMDQNSPEDVAVHFELPDPLFEDVDSSELMISAELSNGLDLPSWLYFDGMSFIGQPPRDFNGALEVTVIASDGELSSTAAFVLKIEAVNDRPILEVPLSDRFVLEDMEFSITLQDAFSDIDGDELIFSATLADASALPDWMVFDPITHTFSGQPPTDFVGSIEVMVSASDGVLSVSNSFIFSVSNLNDAPIIAVPLTDQVFDEDQPIEFTVSESHFSDVDGDELQLTAMLTDGTPLPEWLSLESGQFVGQPPENFNGVLSIAVTASDGLTSVSDEFNLTITPVNDLPVAEIDFGLLAYSGAESLIDPVGLLENDFDPDGDTLSIVDVFGASGGTIELTAAGMIAYNPDESFSGSDTFSYTLSDGMDTSTGYAILTVENPYAEYDQGTDGNDTLFGSLFQQNSIFGGDGDDIVFAGFGGDSLAGGLGDDLLMGLGGSDTIDGNSGNDTLIGGGGDDRLSGGRGDDLLHGGLGSDTFFFREGDGRDTVADLQTGYNGFFFSIAGDHIELDVDGVSSFEDLMSYADQIGSSSVFDFGDGDVLVLSATRLAALDQDMFTFT